MISTRTVWRAVTTGTVLGALAAGTAYGPALAQQAPPQVVPATRMVTPTPGGVRPIAGPPVPVRVALSAVNPSSVVVGSPAQAVRISGGPFTPSSAAIWGTTTCDAIGTNGCSSSYDGGTGELVVNLNASFFASASTTDVTVTNDGTSATTSAGLPFFVTEQPAAVIISSTVSAAGNDAAPTTDPSMGPGSISAVATGTGNLTVAQYASDPMNTASPVGTTAWYDVHVSGSFNPVSVEQCSAPAGSPAPILYWWDSNTSQWETVSNQTANAPQPGCTTATITTSTSPTSIQLTGTVFASAPLNATSLCGLTLRDVQASPRYHSLGSAEQARVDGLTNQACQQLATIKLSPTTKPLAIADYQKSVAVLASEGWLLGPQATQLSAFASNL